MLVCEGRGICLCVHMLMCEGRGMCLCVRGGAYAYV